MRLSAEMPRELGGECAEVEVAGHLGIREASLDGGDDPRLLRVGGLRTAAVLTAPGELKLRGAANFDADTVKAAYRAAGRENGLIIE